MEPILIAGVAIAVTGWLVWHAWFSERAKHRALLRRTGATSVRDVVDGSRAKIIGTVEPDGELLTAPISGRRCVAYCVTVRWSGDRRALSNGGWDDPIAVELSANFCVRDGTGIAHVRPVAPRLLVVDDVHRVSGVFREPDEAMRKFLAANDRPWEGMVFNYPLAYEEGVIEVGERVAVLGAARWEQSTEVASAHYRDVGRTLVLHDDGEHEIYISDDPSTLTAPRRP